ncbi:MAG: thioredoxin [Actinomycetota bacterium]|jgi:thioredoxin 1|nr:thioredoxin [Actinomycetota bacterium]
MSNAKSVTDATFQADVLTAEKPVIVDFWAEWCGPCRKLGPILDDISVQYADKVDVVKVDVDANPAIAAEFGITSIPAVYLFKDGVVKSTVIGARPKQFFEKEFADYLQ